MEELEAIIDSVIFHNDENGYTVLEAKIGRKHVTITGNLPELALGETVLFSGMWVQHPQYGDQFKASSCSLKTPSTPRAIEKYLGSGLIFGVGPATAKLIVQAFGKETLDVLSYEPGRLTEISGIGAKRAAQIAESFKTQHAQRKTIMFLQGIGVPLSLCLKISKRYGEQAQGLIEENPYRLVTDIDGIGFSTADKLAQTLGIAPDSSYRMEAGIAFVMQDAASGYGHTYLPVDEMMRRAEELLHVENRPLLESVLRQMLLNRKMILHTLNGTDNCALEGYYYAEKEIARRLLVLQERVKISAPDTKAVERKIDEFEQGAGITLSPKQRQAVSDAVQKGVMVISGGPGTGKTTMINCILSLTGKGTLLAAPTGRAAKRMSEATGHEAKTLHRLLEYSGELERFSRDENNPLDCSCVIVDEMSMVDIFLMRSLLRAIKPGTKLILVGDADQLPSVGAGNVLRDILNSNTLGKTFLTDIYRQDENSQIVWNAHRINKGEMPVLNQKGSDFFLERQYELTGASDAIVALCKNRLPSFLHSDDPKQDIQVLSPTKKGICGVTALNKQLQAALNPPAPYKQEIIYGDTVFRLGDKVIHIKNNYSMEWISQSTGQSGEGVFNGDMGFVSAIDRDEKILTVQFDDGRVCEYIYQDLEELELAYCLSVHKSQGSEFPCVVIPVVGGPPMLLTRNLLYTALTRACRLVVLVGREDVIGTMVRNNHIAKRYTALGALLCETFS